jgi:hypothetical protein
METAWLSPWIPLLDPFYDLETRHHSALGIYAFFLFAYGSVVGLQMLRLPRRSRTVLLGVLIALSTLVLVWAELHVDYPLLSPIWIGQLLNGLGRFSRRLPAETSLLLVALYIWHRSIALTETGFLADHVIVRFRRGFIVLAFYTSLLLIGPRAIPWETFAFFFFGIVSIALARLLESRVEPGDWRWGRRWLGLLIGATAATIVIGLIVLLLLSLGEFAVGRLVLDLISEAVDYVLGLWATIPGVLMDWIVNTMVAFLEGRPVPTLTFPEPVRGGSDPIDGSTAPGGLPPVVHIAGQVIILALLGLAVAVLARRVVRRARRAPRRTPEVERESIPISGTLVDGWQRIVGAARRSGLPSRYATRSIRTIYASLVAYAGRLGYPREPAQTPYDFLPTLKRAFPDAQDEVEHITEQYIRTHYAEKPETPERLAEVRASWNQIQAMEAHRWGLVRER